MIEADFTVLRDSFRLNSSFHDSGITLLSGENGSGKSTFLNALAGFIPVQSGKIRLNGRDVTQAEVQRRGMVLVTSSSYMGNLGVDRHIAFPGKPDRDPERVRELRESFGIDYYGKVGSLSMGQRIRVSLATAFYRRAEAVLIDEALSNLSEPMEVLGEISTMSGSLKADVIIVAHSLPEIRPDHHYVMENGNMRREY